MKNLTNTQIYIIAGTISILLGMAFWSQTQPQPAQPIQPVLSDTERLLFQQQMKQWNDIQQNAHESFQPPSDFECENIWISQPDINGNVIIRCLD
jgi:hypothetical protein